MREQWSGRCAIRAAWCALALAGALAAAPAPARAEVALTYLGPDADPTCPSPAQVEASMRAEMPDADFAADGTTTVVARVAAGGGRYRAELTILGPGLPVQTRTFEDADCAAVTDALVIALARYQQGHPAAVASHAAPRATEPRARATGEAIVALGATAGVFATVAPSGAFGGELLHDDWSWGGRLAIVYGTSPDENALLAGSVDACLRTTTAFGCALVGVGRLEAHDFTELYGFLGGRVGLELGLGRRAALAPAAELHISTNDTDDQSYGVRRVSGTISLGILVYAFAPPLHR